MRLIQLLGILSITALLAACSAGHLYTSNGSCITCINNPITGNPVNHDGQPAKVEADPKPSTQPASTGYKGGGEGKKSNEYSFQLPVPMNVDLVYLRLKQEFGYHSEQEIRQKWGSMTDMKTQTFSYAWDVQPHIYYRMRATREHDGRHHIIESYVEKQSDKESMLTMTFWILGDGVDPNRLEQSLTQRVKNKLNIN